MSIPDWLADIQKSFRMKRMRRFASALRPASSQRILDVGGSAEIWRFLPQVRNVVLLNMPRAGEGQTAAAVGLRYVHGDGCRLPFADGSFDIVFSNSVIEHVGSEEAQQEFAREVARVGRAYWIQTPNRHFPIETHLLTPLVHLFPRRLRAAIVRRFTVWDWVRRPAADEKRFYIEHFIADIHLLSAAQMRRLFPDAVIVRERFFLFTKSLIAWRRYDP